MISIIVPIYNTEQYLAHCVDSLIAQETSEPLQIILVDDGSTDKSAAIAGLYAEKDPRIVVLSQPHAGQSAARNLAMAHAKGEYIAFVDADDAIEPDWCERHLTAIGGADYVQSGYKRVSPDGKLVEGTAPKGRWPLYVYQFTSPCTRLYRREAIEGMRFREGMIYEDVLFSSDLWMRGLKCRIIKYSGYLYTFNPQSTTATRHPEDEKKLFASLQAKLKGQTLKNKLIILLTITRLRFHFLRA